MALKAKKIDLIGLVRLIRKSKKILIATHVNPDADGIGSMLGLGQALKALGKTVTLYMRDPVPQTCHFLPGQGKIVSTLPKIARFDLSFIVDLGDVERVGEEFTAHPGRGITVSIDHHLRGAHNADLNFCLPKQAASGEVVYKILKALKAPFNKSIATCLYTAIATDTGTFRYSNTTRESFIISADLLKYGVDVWQVALNCFETSSLAKLKLLERILSRMTTHKNGKIAWIEIWQRDIAETGAMDAETDGFITYPRSLDGVEVAMAFRESRPGEFKVSLRSKNYVDVGLVAASLGGGGHKKASGVTLRGSLDEVRKTLLERIVPLISKT